MISAVLPARPPHIILGIDPGTIVMGYGLIAVSKSKITLVEMGVLHLAKKQDHAERLEMIFKKMESLIRLHQPAAVAIEAPFFGKNVQSMLKLGRAQGVAIAAAMRHGLEVTEYSPKKVKQSITGNGNADKEQVWKMLQRLTITTEKLKGFDASDALAVAVCHHFQTSSTVIAGSAKLKGWSDFLAKNPGRVI